MKGISKNSSHQSILVVGQKNLQSDENFREKPILRKKSFVSCSSSLKVLQKSGAKPSLKKLYQDWSESRRVVAAGLGEVRVRVQSSATPEIETIS